MKQNAIYVTTGTPIFRKAHAIQTFFTCKYLSKFFNIKLVYPFTLSVINMDIKKEYEKENLDLIFLPITPLMTFFRGSLSFLLDRLIYSFFVFSYLLLKGIKTIVVRDQVVAFFLNLTRPVHRGKILFELHNPEWMLQNDSRVSKIIYKKLGIFAIKNSDYVITLSKWTKNYVKKWNRNVEWMPSAFEDKIFKPMKKQEARRRLGLKQKEKIVLYTGLTLGEKLRGMDILIKSSKLLPGNFKIFIVGGYKSDIRELRKFAKKINAADRIRFFESVPINSVVTFLNAADALVLPYRKHIRTQHFGSPLKLFEYMAVKKPIVTTDVETHLAILDKNSAIIVKNSDVVNLAEGIKKAALNKKLAEKTAKNAYKKCKEFTYAKRAERIRDIIIGIR